MENLVVKSLFCFLKIFGQLQWVSMYTFFISSIFLPHPAQPKGSVLVQKLMKPFLTARWNTNHSSVPRSRNSALFSSLITLQPNPIIYSRNFAAKKNKRKNVPNPNPPKPIVPPSVQKPTPLNTGVDTLLINAGTMIEKGKFKEAIQILEILKKQKQPEELLMMLSMSYLSTNQIEKGMELLKESTSLYPKSSYFLIQQAMVHHNASRYEPTIPLLTKALENDPQNMEALLTLASSLMFLKRTAESLTYCEKALESDPKSEDAKYIKSQCLLESSKPIDWQTAVTLLKEIIEAKNYKALCLLTKALLKIDLKSSVIEYLSTFHPTRDEDIVELGRAYRIAGDHTKAHNILKDIVIKQPQNFSFQYYFGTILAELGKPNEALTFFESAAKMNPVPEYLNSLGVIYNTLGRKDQALSTWEQAYQMSPTHPRVNVGLGTLAADSYKFEKALQHFETAFLTEKSSTIFQMLAKMLLSLYRPLEVVNYCEKYWNLLGKEPPILLVYAQALIMARDMEKAAKILHELSEISSNMDDPKVPMPQYSKAHFDLGRYFREKSIFDRANYHLMLAKLIDAKPQHCYELAQAYLQENKIQNAKEELLECISLDERYALGYLQLGLLAQKCNEHEEAIKYFESAEVNELKEATFHKGKSLYALGRFDEARQVFESIPQEDSNREELEQWISKSKLPTNNAELPNNKMD
jgi:tetratricopeptide (TPR) repeat protein